MKFHCHTSGIYFLPQERLFQRFYRLSFIYKVHLVSECDIISDDCYAQYDSGKASPQLFNLLGELFYFICILKDLFSIIPNIE